MSTVRGAVCAFVLLTSCACAGDSSGPLDLDGTWLADLRIETQSDTGETFSEDFDGYELVVDQVGPSVSFAGVLGTVSGSRVSFGSTRTGSRSEDGDWERGWWRVRSEGWADREEAEIDMRIEVWDSGGTEIVGLHQQYHFTNFTKLDEPKRPQVEVP